MIGPYAYTQLQRSGLSRANWIEAIRWARENRRDIISGINFVKERLISAGVKPRWERYINPGGETAVPSTDRKPTQGPSKRLDLRVRNPFAMSGFPQRI